MSERIADGTVLRTGPLAYRVGYADVGAIYWDRTEILQRIFVTVRDGKWREIPPSEWSTEGSCDRITFAARHVADGFDFAWRGEFAFDPGAPAISFAFSGMANRDMEICRLGIAVVHPVKNVVGEEIVTVGPAGRHSQKVGEAIHPQLIENGTFKGMTPSFSALVMPLKDFGTLSFQFTGDLFEMEDQRNWCDASFKTYCTPLSVPFPRTMKAGATVTHNLTIAVSPRSHRAGLQRTVEDQIVLSPTADPIRLPDLGAEVTGAELTGDLPWSFLRVDADDEADRAVFERVDNGTTSLEIVAVADARGVGADARRFIETHRERIRRAFIAGDGVSLPTRTAFDAANEQIEANDEREIFAATKGYFVELQRGPLYALPADGVGFPVSVTVHCDDPWTIAENVAGLADMIRSARTITGHQAVAISPLALYYPHTSSGRFADRLVAPWLLAIFANAAEAGPRSLTLGSDIIRALRRGEHSNPHLLAWLVAASGMSAVPLSVDAAAGIFALAHDDCVFVANLGAGAATLGIVDSDGTNVLATNDALSVAPSSVAHGVLSPAARAP